MSNISSTVNSKAFEELLVMQCQAGDKKAFELLFKRWNKKLLAFSTKYTHDVEAAKDVMQDCWVVIFNRIGDLQQPAQFGAWAYRITYNKTIDFLKKTRRQQDADHNQEVDLESDDEAINTDKLLAVLPNEQKVILTLFYLEQLAIKDIANILQLPEGTVKSKLFYAREKLKNIINKHSYEKFR